MSPIREGAKVTINEAAVGAWRAAIGSECTFRGYGLNQRHAIVLMGDKSPVYPGKEATLPSSWLECAEDDVVPAPEVPHPVQTKVCPLCGGAGKVPA